MGKGIHHDMIRSGETQFEAIVRISHYAGANGYDGYCVDCNVCGMPIDSHREPGYCQNELEVRRKLLIFDALDALQEKQDRRWAELKRRNVCLRSA
jgi:hypothetical protein